MSLQKKTDTEWVAPLGWCLAIAFAVRILISIFFPASLRSDEIYQYFEPALRAVSGHGVVTWEWRDGIRSWLVPGFIAGLLKISATFGLGFSAEFVRSIFCFLSLPLVALSVWAGWRLGGRQGAWLCGLGMALWPDVANAGPRPLGEYFGGNIIAMATILGSIILGQCKDNPNQKPYILLLLCGFLFGLGAAIRFQFMPAAFFGLLFLSWKGGLRTVYPVIFSFLIPIIILGIIDYETLDYPFQSIIKNYYMNSTLGIANNFGKESKLYFVMQYIGLWGCASIAIFILCKKGISSCAFPFFMSICILFYHSCISHKEISFIYPSIPLLIFTALAGLVYYVQVEKNIKFINSVYLVVLCCLIVFHSGYEKEIKEKQVYIKIEKIASKQTYICGLALLYSEVNWADFGGYTYMKKGVPLYLFDSINDLSDHAGMYSHVIGTESFKEYNPEAQTVACKKNICLYKVSNACDKGQDFDQISKKLKVLGK